MIINYYLKIIIMELELKLILDTLIIKILMELDNQNQLHYFLFLYVLNTFILDHQNQHQSFFYMRNLHLLMLVFYQFNIMFQVYYLHHFLFHNIFYNPLLLFILMINFFLNNKHLLVLNMIMLVKLILYLNFYEDFFFK